MFGHELNVSYDTDARSFVGVCECSDPDWDGGWYGQVEFYGASEDSIVLDHLDHLDLVGV